MMGMMMTVESRYPVATHVISSTEAPSDPRMWGSATLTMLMSSAAMIVPVITVTVTIHLCALCRSSMQDDLLS